MVELIETIGCYVAGRSCAEGRRAHVCADGSQAAHENAVTVRE
jgi:hypothetical protein